MDVLATFDDAENFWLEGTLHLDASAGGLAFRLDDKGGGYFVELFADTSEVSLRKWLPASATGDPGRPWFRQVELQRGNLPRQVARVEPIPFRLIVVGPYLECSLASEVVLATLSAERTTGRVGVWAESGSASITSLLWTPMRVPIHR
jgi:hypothetical protein